MVVIFVAGISSIVKVLDRHGTFSHEHTTSVHVDHLLLREISAPALQLDRPDERKENSEQHENDSAFT